MTRTYILVVDGLGDGGKVTHTSWYVNGGIRGLDESMLDEIVELKIETTEALLAWLNERCGRPPTGAPNDAHYSLPALADMIDDFFVIFTGDGRIHYVEQLRAVKRAGVSWGEDPVNFR